MLAILFWVILVLSILGIFAPPTWTYGNRIIGGTNAILFIIIGLRLFRVSLS